MRFHETINSPNPVIYDDVTTEEFYTLYSLLPTLNKLYEQNKKLKRSLERTLDLYESEFKHEEEELMFIQHCKDLIKEE